MPARLLVKERNTVVDRPADQLSELRGEHPCWLDISDPGSEEFTLVAKELDLHPLAVEDAQHGHQRPKIDQYENHYFIVFYAVEAPSPGVVVYHEVAIFVAQNAIVTVHNGDFTARRIVEKRFVEGRLQTTGLLLHALLDTMVDQYFEVVDQFGERIELLEEFIAAETSHEERDPHTPLRELFLVKRDLLQLRKTIAPERDVLQVLVRGDIRELRETGRRAYFQDVYDHIIRVTDEIDTFRELSSNVIDAYLAAASNRLNEVMKVLTSLATVLLVLTVVTGFFGQNWAFIPYHSLTLFWLSIGLTGIIAVGLAMYFRRRGWL
ncbi:MAG TPA: magnesium/cobalt transporter CorA [Candidatus Limnocylindria bacterium]|jgi:magnesium transporter|nr:magnesium/cobalt transporter CorA [Candidatus Limnocylindria bacterium]